MTPSQYFFFPKQTAAILEGRNVCWPHYSKYIFLVVGHGGYGRLDNSSSWPSIQYLLLLFNITNTYDYSAIKLKGYFIIKKYKFVSEQKQRFA